MIDSMLQVPSGLDLSGSQASEELAKQIGTVEWLGPLAPVALSPFFGIAVLSGMATYGPDFLQKNSGLIAETSPLNNVYLFWTMAALAMLTSLPRFSKVSKPLALAAEQLESYASVIILVGVKFLSSANTTSASPQSELVLAGVGAVPLDTLMSLAAALNVIVINTVKLFFELVVWMVPIPTVDALLEISQKSLCVGMMSLYCYSPLLATVLNLLLLSVCAVVFGWVVRKTAYYRHLIIRPVLAWLWPTWFGRLGDSFTAYAEQPVGGLPAYVPFTVRQISHMEFEVRGRWLWRSFSHHFKNATVLQESGILADRLRLRDSEIEMSFSYCRLNMQNPSSALA